MARAPILSRKSYTQFISLIVIVTALISLYILSKILTIAHPTTMQTSYISKSKTIASKVKTAIANDPELSKLKEQDAYPFRLWWISDDNWNIIIDSNVEHLGLFLATKDSETEYYLKNPTNYPQAKKFHKLVADIMNANGYVRNTTNSSKDEQDHQDSDYLQAYTSSDAYCVASTNFDLGSNTSNSMGKTMELNCASKQSFQAAYNEQMPFLKGLNNHTEVVSGITILDGDKARMSINGRRTGAGLFMYKDGADWKEIITAQGVPPCSELTKRNIPRKYWIGCYQENGEMQKGTFGN